MMRVNFYGGPGVGKSTLAAMTYSWLRQHGHSAELVQEWVKNWAYLSREIKSFDYVYTFASQLHLEDRLLQAGVKWIVTDSPIYLQCMYALRHKQKAANELWRIAKRFEGSYPSINFYVARSPFVVYEQAGRYEDLNQALEMDDFIVTCLYEWHIPFTHVLTGEIDSVIPLLNKIENATPKSRKRKSKT
jgi:thymidylate kinase